MEMVNINDLFVSQKDYDAIKKGKDVLIVVEAQGKKPMYARLSYDVTNNSLRKKMESLFGKGTR